MFDKGDFGIFRIFGQFQGGEKAGRIALLGTFETDQGVDAFTTFAWPRGETERERLHDGNGTNSNRLLQLNGQGWS